VSFRLTDICSKFLSARLTIYQKAASFASDNNNNSNEMKVSVENREFTIIVEEEPEGRGFSGQCKELPSAISQGKTLEELEVNIKDAIQLVLDIQKDRFRQH
jgi:predicted RNase H-like HicB family nuclease